MNERLVLVPVESPISVATPDAVSTTRSDSNDAQPDSDTGIMAAVACPLPAVRRTQSISTPPAGPFSGSRRRPRMALLAAYGMGTPVQPVPPHAG